MPPTFFELYGRAFPLLTVFVFIFGACFGSFANVCIWRLPLGESVVTRPSHCPKCEHQIAWYENIPICSWLALRGRCSSCHAPISPRYLIVEAVTGLLFVVLWFRVWEQQWPLTLCLQWSLVLMALVAVTMIDLRHYMIPDQITLTGIAMAMLAVLIWPESHLHGSLTADLLEPLRDRWPLTWRQPRVKAVADAVLGMGVGAGILWFLGEAGKLLFGRVRRRAAAGVPARLTAAALTVADEAVAWDALFGRTTDRARISGRVLAGSVGGVPLAPSPEPVVVSVSLQSIRIGQQDWPLAAVGEIEIEATEWVLPREVMGLGDVKLMAMLGAVMGPGAAVFILFFSSLLGTVIGVTLGLGALLEAPGERRRRLPYGPFIAVAALVYMLRGSEWIALFRYRFGGFD